MCGCEDPQNFVRVKFIGGFEKKGLQRGPWKNHVTGKTYTRPERYADKESYPYFEYVRDATEDEIEEPWRTRLGLKPVKEKPKPKKEKKEDTSSTDTLDDNIDITVLVDDPGITEFNESSAPAQIELLNGMNIPTLRAYIRGQGGQVDGRWGKNRLIQEAMKVS